MTKSDIKTKESKPKTVKTLDKTVVWTERIKDSIVCTNEKAKDVAEDNSSITDYGEDKIKYISNRAKDESIYRSKKTKNKVIDNAKKKYQKNKLIKEKSKNVIKDTIKTKKKTIKTAKNTIKNTERVTKETAKATKKMAEQGKKLAIEGTKKAVQFVKVVTKAIVSGIKALMAGVKSLIGMLAAGGVAAVIAIVIICLIGLLVTSIYGIFFSSEDTGSNIKMSDCIAELNIEMDNKIKEIENNTPHDEVIIESDKAEWKDVLAIYTIKVSNDNKNEVITIDNNKKSILKQIFWDMNSISNEVITEVYNEDDSIDYVGNIKENIEKRVLHIRISSKTINDMTTTYNFNKNQVKQLAELTNNNNNQSLWNYAIYGNYGSSGTAESWKQSGESWSNIRIGNTNRTIGDIGCLVTSISILIKKSGVSTGSVFPFNPGTFVSALNNNYGFDKNGNLLYSPISKLVPNFKYVGRINLSGKSQIEKLKEIKKYYDIGYYIAIKVVDTDTSQHWVALDNIKSNRIIMSDPASKSTDMWKEYNWNSTTQFIYFKAEK